LLQTDIPNAPVVKWRAAEAGKLYTLMMLDLDGNANGSWPDPVPIPFPGSRFLSHRRKTPTCATASTTATSRAACRPE